MSIQITNFDFLAITVVGISSAWGLLKGASKTLVWATSIIACIYILTNHLTFFEAKLAPLIRKDFLKIAAIMSVIVVMALINKIMGKIIKHLLTSIGIGILDNFFGLVLGFVRGALLVIIIVKMLLINDQLFKFMEINKSKSWPVLKIYVKQDFHWQTANLSSLKIYLHKQLDRFVSLSNKHAPKHHR